MKSVNVCLVASDRANTERIGEFIDRYRKYRKMSKGSGKIRKVFIIDKSLKKHLGDYRCKIVNKIPYTNIKAVLFYCHYKDKMQNEIDKSKERKEKGTDVFIHYHN